MKSPEPLRSAGTLSACARIAPGRAPIVKGEVCALLLLHILEEGILSRSS